MNMKILTCFLFIIVAASAIDDDTEINWSKVVPVEEVPGFWDSRPLLKQQFLKSSSGRNGRIVGGAVVAPHSIPFMIGLIMANAGGRTWICGASLINARTTMTAAHCLSGSTRTTIVAGAHQLQANEPSQQRREVQPSSYRIHEGYQGNHRNDIALLHHFPVSVNSFVSTVVLPTAFRNEQFVGEQATMSGWGVMGTGLPLSTHLRAITQPVVSLAQCEQIFGSLGPATICTSSAGGRSTCISDSGGPVTIRRSGQTIQIGIAAFIGNGCEGGLPNGHVRVTSFLDWIDRNRVQI